MISPSGRRKLGGWFRILRLQFYAMTALSYGLGAAASLRQTEAPVPGALLAAGFLFLIILEMASVFLNEIHDLETDSLNRNAGPFTGGSRVLVEGILTPAQVHRAAKGLLGCAGLLAMAILMGSREGDWLPELLLLLAALCLGPGYTAPPLRLVYRGWGEITVAFTHSLLMLLLGWCLAGGRLLAPLPWLLGLPMFAAVFSAISLAGIPDACADRQVSKQTVAARRTPAVAAWWALSAAVAAPLSALLAARSAPVAQAAFTGLLLPSSLHGFFLLALILRYLARGAGCRRIDFILLAALSHVLWYSLAPLFQLQS